MKVKGSSTLALGMPPLQLGFGNGEVAVITCHEGRIITVMLDAYEAENLGVAIIQIAAHSRSQGLAVVPPPNMKSGDDNV